MLLNTSTFHFRHSTCCRAACSSADQDPRHFSMSCPIIFTALVWLRLPLYLQHRLKHTPHCIPDRLALIGRAWETFRPGPGSGKAPIVWMAGICFGQLQLFESILAWMRWKEALKGSTERKTVIISPSSTAVHLNFTLTRRGGRGKLWPPGLAASAS